MAELKKSDLVKNWLLGYSSETCYNYERLQGLGNTNAFVPIIRALLHDHDLLPDRAVFIGDSTPSRSAISVVAACPISSERRKYPVFAETAVALWMVRTP